MADVVCSGPIFDGRAAEAGQRGAEAIRQAVAAEGKKIAAATLAGAIRVHHTGDSWRTITVTEDSAVYQTGKYTMPVTVGQDESVVTSTLATYGPWLESTGSRNQTTRFKGYNSFRIACQELDTTAGDIADEAIKPYVEAMN